MMNKLQSLLGGSAPERCAICDKPLVGSCRMDKWGQKACIEHDFLPCSNCGRMTRPDDIHLPDGRHVCSFCKGKIVRKPEHVEWVYQRVLEIFEQNILSLPGKIPVEVVTTEQMLTYYRNPNSGVVPSGLTTSGGAGIFGAKLHHKVYMLDNQHKVLFGGVLAHELLHVWQNEHHIKLPPQHCEGFCNLGSLLFYNYIDNELSQRLAEWLLASPDPIYGEGLRQVKAIFESEGGHNLEKTAEILVEKNRRI